MIKAYLLVSALAASGLCMPQFNGSEFCTTPKLSEEEKKEAREEMAATEAASLLEARQTITVQTYLHVIAKDNTVAGGYLSVRSSPDTIVYNTLTRHTRGKRCWLRWIG